MWVTSLLSALGSFLSALFSWLNQQALRKAGRNEVLLEEAREAERERREREDIDERIRNSGDSSSTDELRKRWTRH